MTEVKNCDTALVLHPALKTVGGHLLRRFISFREEIASETTRGDDGNELEPSYHFLRLL